MTGRHSPCRTLSAGAEAAAIFPTSWDSKVSSLPCAP
nr:MAG TPA: hypothetical protein [Caudoviricetes sp.]